MYIKFLPNEYVIRYRKSKRVAEGKGLSFYYFDKSTAVAVIPVSGMDRDPKTDLYYQTDINGRVLVSLTQEQVKAIQQKHSQGD